MQAARNTSEEGKRLLKSVEVGDTSLSYIDVGVGEPVVFVHGAVSDLRMWREQVEAFSHHFRAISYSLRGHWPAEPEKAKPYLRSLHTLDLIGFLNALDLKKVHLVGHSFGGAIALLTALENPDLVASLVLGEPSPFLSLFGETEVDFLANQKLGFEEAYLLAQRGYTEAAVRQFLNVIVGADVLDQLPRAARAVVMDNALTLAPMLDHYFESPPVSRDQLKKLTIPVLLISGEFSPKIAVVNNNLLHNSLPNSKEVTLHSGSYGLHIENPSGFNQLVLNFFAKRQ
jgi:pimeloyl-ACP methyl ester carboxylesterase